MCFCKGGVATALYFFIYKNEQTKSNMQILVDADACPVVGIVEKIAKEKNIPCTLLCDTNHILNSDYAEVKIIGAEADADGAPYGEKSKTEQKAEGTFERACKAYGGR